MAVPIITVGIGTTNAGTGANMGGSTQIWALEHNLFVSATGASGSYTSLTMGATADLFMLIGTAPLSGDDKSSYTYNETDGASHFDINISGVVPIRQASTVTALQSFANGKKLIVVTKDGNGRYWLQGINNGLIMTKNEGTSGKAPADGSKYTFTLMGHEPQEAWELTAGGASAVGITG